MLSSHVTMVRTVARNKLSRVAIVSVPRLFASVERSRIRVALRLEIKNGVDSTGCATDPKHNRVLI